MVYVEGKDQQTVRSILTVEFGK